MDWNQALVAARLLEMKNHPAEVDDADVVAIDGSTIPAGERVGSDAARDVQRLGCHAV